jgi:hypothetical protein
MARSKFLGGAYTLRSHPLAAQTAINVYLEPNESQSGEPAGLYGTPGLLKKATLPTSGCRGQRSAGGYLWGVYGNTVYRLNSAFSGTPVGTLPNSSGAVSMEHNGTVLVIGHAAGWHSVNLSTSAFAAVSGSPTMSDVSFIDNYLVGAQDDGTYTWANLNSTTIDALNFASAEGSPDPIIRTLADHRELWLFGTSTIEVAVVTSDPDLPFTRTSFIEQGILAPHTACKEDNSVFWLGRNESGQGVVYVAEGYIPRRISTFAIEQEIATYARPEEATAYTYQQDGHHYYVLSFAEATWAFDINTQVWHQRAYRNTTTGELERHRGTGHAFFGGMHLVGDYADGRLYALDLNTFTDDGDEIYRERAWPGEDNENRWTTYHRGELIGEMGVGLSGRFAYDDPLLDEGGELLLGEDDSVLMADHVTDPGTDPRVWLQWSHDAVQWGNAHDRSIGRMGQRLIRAIWRRMGKSRRRYFRIWTSEPVRIAWYGFNYDTEVSNG